MKQLMTFFILVISFTMISTANAGIMTFDGLSSVAYGQFYSDDYNFRVRPETIMNFGGVTSSDAPDYAGSDGIVQGSAGRYSIFEALDGSTFDFNSIDLTERFTSQTIEARAWQGWEQPTSIDAQFIGTFADGSTASYLASLDLIFGFENFNFGDIFSDVVSVKWFQSSTVASYYVFDNIVWNDDSQPPTPTPEPATFILLGSGLAGLAFYRRKRK